ncbi:sigma-54 interaction domain-containing protein [Neobacillus mesonae]|nr:sigma 54-interacting transcriptional regulator [Neobacillus mesonae]
MSEEKNLLEQALKSLKLDIEIFQSPIKPESVPDPNSFIVHSSEFSLSGSKYTANLAIPKEILQTLTKELPEYYNMELDLNTILNHCREVIFVSDGSGKVMRVSSSWKKLWEAEGKGFFDKGVLQVEKEGVISPSATRLVLEKKEQVQIVQQTNTGRTLMVTGIPIKNEDGDIQRIISMSEDITEISYLKQELKSEKVKNEKLHALLFNHEVSSLVFNSAAMDNVLHTVLKIANVDSTVLISGESGVGKEVIAHYIHQWSDRADKPFIKVNCGSIPENLLESELFGYTKGSFTGALKEGKQGLFEAANEGTIFLDEIGEMPFSLQVKLLRVLQEQEVTRIGETSPTKINVRVIAATNRSLPEEIKKKSFREDLYYRLNVVPIHIPPLRERREDLLPLILHFTDEFNRKFSKRKVFSQEAIKHFYSYSWPGNIRELRNIIERLIVMADADYLEPVHLLSIIRDETEDLVMMQTVESVGMNRNLQPSLAKDDQTFSTLSKFARHYRRLGITHGEWGLICAIFTYKSVDWTFHFTEEELAAHLDCGTRQIRKWLYSLRKKEMLILERSWKKTGYNFKPLLVKAERAVRI